MAGYLFGLDSEESLAEAIEFGLYSTRLSYPKAAKWSMPHEGTFADYSSMKAGDDVYFFIERKIFGIGKLVNITDDCKGLNFPGANSPYVYTGMTNDRFLYLYPKASFDLLTEKAKDELSYKEYIQQYRFVCFFKPSPHFFEDGIDMDDMLTSEPSAFKILRDFYQKSFIKIDDDENQAFKNLILRRNFNENSAPEFLNTNYVVEHAKVLNKLNNDDYTLDIKPFLSTINDGQEIKHEMAIEAAIIHQLSEKQEDAIAVFGNWDYLSHQVPASPQKPNAYLDRIDIFGYSYIVDQFPTKSKFLILEAKRGVITKEILSQLMKYVDFIKDEYAYNDYSMISAFLVGYDFDEECIASLKDVVTRNYIHGLRPSVTKTWRNVKLVKYAYDEDDDTINFEIVANANED